MTPEAPTLVHVLAERAREHPERTAFTFLDDGQRESDRLTFGGLDRRARALARRLATAPRGERALLLLPGGLDFIVAFFACLRAGMAAVPAYPPRRGRPDPRLPVIVRQTRPAWVVTTGSLHRRGGALCEAVPDLSPATWVVADSEEPDEAMDGRDEMVESLPEVGPRDLAFLQYTSGSTATPRGVAVSHANLMSNEEAIRRSMGQSERSVVVGWLPLYHDMGLVGNVLQPVYSGGRAILMPPLAFLQNPARWLRAIDRYEATTSGGPDFAYDLCARSIAPEDRDGLDLSSWDLAYNGSEPVRAETLRRFTEAFQPCGFRAEAWYPCYGLAEATLLVSGGTPGKGARTTEISAASLEAHGVRPAAPEEDAAELVSSGDPAPGVEVVLMDPDGQRPSPPGHVGEIWLRGPGVADGYWGRPEASRQAFEAEVPGRPGETFLRTGDLGFLQDGELFVTGRVKDLLVVRGRNLYPHDLEAAAAEVPGMRPAAGAAFTVRDDGRDRLVLVQEVERRFDGDLGRAAARLRGVVAARCAVTLDEVVLVRRGGVPRTSSGKIQRHRCRARYEKGELPVLERTGGRPRRTDAPDSPSWPEGPGLRLEPLRQTAARILDVDPQWLDPEAPLTALGLDSLGLSELRQRCLAETGTAPSLAWLLEEGTLEATAAWLDRETTAAPPEPLPRAAREAELPASPGQRRLWLLDRWSPSNAETSGDHLPFGVSLTGPLGTTALADSWHEVERRHEPLRTVLPERDGEPVQRVLPPSREALRVVDVSGLASPEDVVGRLERHEAWKRFDLARGPVTRRTLVRFAPRRHALWITFHHAAADGASMPILRRELEAAYDAFRRGAPAGLPVLPARYADWSLAQRLWLDGPEAERQRSFWRRHLAGRDPSPDLPGDGRPEEGVAPAHTVRGRLAQPLADSIAAWARTRGATRFMIAMAAFGALLRRHGAAATFVVGTPVDGRDRPELARLVGLFINTLPLVLDLTGDPDFTTLVERVRRETLDVFEHGRLPLERITQALAADGSEPAARVRVLLVDQGPANPPPALSGVDVERLPRDAPGTALDLSLSLVDDAPGWTVHLQARASRWSRTAASRLVRRYRILLEDAVGHPTRSVSELSLLSRAERHQILRELNDTATPERDSRSPWLHRPVVLRAASDPDAVAVVAGRRHLSYGELVRRSRGLASRLRDAGVGPDHVVAIHLVRSPEQMVAILGVLLAGAAYLPLEPSLPEHRMYRLAEQAGTRVGVTDAAGLPALERAGVTALSVGPPADVRPALPRATWDEAEATPDAAAYVIFTSGSTGRPKGVVVPHRGPAHRVASAIRAYGLGPGDVTLHVFSFAFDASVALLFQPLASGGRLVLASPGEEADPAALVRLLTEESVTLTGLPAAMVAELARRPDLAGARALRFVGTGVDVLPTSAAEAFLSRTGATLVNGYGPTEASISVTRWFCRRRGAGERVPIGRPIDGCTVYLTDPRGHPVPLGAPGEVLLGGVAVTRGYLDQPARTAEVFLPDPFAERPGARLYRTGDSARHRPDGGLVFLGRADAQVKVRGHRVELGEVEIALARHAAVTEAAVVLRDDAPGGRGLVAYVATAPGSPVTESDLRRHLETRLPPYMVPAAFVRRPSLPHTAGGKVDRRSLPAPETEPVEAIRAPASEVAAILTGIFASLLERDAVSPDRGFFEAGGHSLLAARAVARIREALDVELPLREIFEHPTATELARRIEELRRTRPLPPMVPRDEDGPAPLAFAQERLWLLSRLAPGGAAYHMAGVLDLTGPVVPSALAGAVAEVTRRHEALRTALRDDAAGPRQWILPPPPSRLPEVDLRGLPVSRRDRQARVLARALARRPFDLERGPLFRAVGFRRTRDRYQLAACFHHAVVDGASLARILEELGGLYAGAVAGVASPFAEPPLQLADFAVWQRRVASHEASEAELTSWVERLRHVPPVLDLPTDRPRPPRADHRGGTVEWGAPKDLRTGIARVARRHGATPFLVVLTVLGALLGRLAGRRRVAVGLPASLRDRPETEGVVGCLLNLLVLPLDLSGAAGWNEALPRVRSVVLDGLGHRDVAFERILSALRPPREPGRHPLFQVLVAQEETAAAPGDAGGLTWSFHPVDGGTAKLDLSVSLATDGASGRFEYSAELFDRTTVTRWVRSFHAALDAWVTDPEAPIEDAWLTPAQAHQLRCEWNGRGRAAPPDSTLPALWARAAQRDPNSVALVAPGAGKSHWRRGELHRTVRRLAARLQAEGVAPGARVGVCLDRTAELVPALLAVLEAGAAYVPLDPTHPPARLAAVAGDAGVEHIVTRSEWRETGSGGVRRILLDRLPPDDEAPERAPGAAVRPGPPPEALAYVLYTSGSTGRPKGVPVPHGALAAFLRAMAERPGLGPGDVLAAVTTISFDIAALELFLPLITPGARTVLLDAATARDPERLARALAASGATHLQATPTTWRMLTEAGWRPPRGFGVLSGGEALPAALARTLAAGGARVWNLYGPTEATVWATVEEVDPGVERMTIGRPLPGWTARVLDANLLPVPPGAVGELVLGGVGLAWGYWNRPDETAKRFVPDPSGRSGDRLYRTGDRARHMADGRLECLGRVDDQVKVRGFRVEPAEVEAVLETHPEVSAAAVVARPDPRGETRLVAYLTLAEGAEPEPSRWRRFLGERLPAYMLPAVFVPLAALPRTTRGKLDRSALPDPFTDGVGPDPGSVAPRDAAEAELARLWSEVLGRETVGVDANFFELGGDSVAATRVATRARQAGWNLEPMDLFRHQTVAGLAAAVEPRSRPTPPGEAPELPESPESPENPGVSDEEMSKILQQVAPGEAP